MHGCIKETLRTITIKVARACVTATIDNEFQINKTSYPVESAESTGENSGEKYT